MRLHVIVRVDPTTPDRPPTGSKVVVELRDTSLADAPSVVVASGEGRIADGQDATVAEVDLDVDESAIDPRATLTVAAQATAGSRETRAPGDWITMESYPLRLDASEPKSSAAVDLRKIR
jgi:uncharacterized lipoprotein YbaY